MYHICVADYRLTIFLPSLSLFGRRLVLGDRVRDTWYHIFSLHTTRARNYMEFTVLPFCTPVRIAM